MERIILASGSPRRKEILEQVGFSFEVHPSGKEEIITKTLPNEIVMELSQQKAKDVAEQYQGDVIVIGADTIVSNDGEILGKPKDEKNAFEMIQGIQGKAHQVYTGVCIIIKDAKKGNKQILFAEKTMVQVAEMTKEEIWAYISTKEPMDKAGGYGIQGTFAKYILGIEGDYYNVVGLPIAKIYEVLRKEINEKK